MALIKKGKKGFWISYLHKRVVNGRNFVGVIQGEVGTGKSYSGLSIGEMLDPNFNIDNIVFNGSDLMKLINGETKKLYVGSCILFEEVGIEMDAHKWQSVQNQMIKYLLETCRHRRFVLLMTTPFMTRISKGGRNLIHGVFETRIIDFDKNICKLKPMLLQYNARYDKTYWKYLKVGIPGSGYQKVSTWNVPKPSLELIKAYEEKKMEFTKELYKKITMQLKSADSGKIYKREKEKWIWKCGKCGNTREYKVERPTRCGDCGINLYKWGVSLGKQNFEDKPDDLQKKGANI